jgi:hypothetical protein
MNQQQTIHYPIQKQYIERLGGILISEKLPIGSHVALQGNRYTIYRQIPVTLRLFVTSNIVTVSYGDYKLYGTAKIKRFANLLGIMNQSALIHCFFQKAVITESIASVELQFHSFTDENIFISWNS